MKLSFKNFYCKREKIIVFFFFFFADILKLTKEVVQGKLLFLQSLGDP